MLCASFFVRFQRQLRILVRVGPLFGPYSWLTKGQLTLKRISYKKFSSPISGNLICYRSTSICC